MEWEIILVDKPSLPIWTGPRKSNRMRYDNFVSMKFIYRLIAVISVQDTLIRFPPLTHLRSMIQPSAVHWGFTLITTKTSQMMTGSVKKWKSCRWGVWCTSNNALPIVKYLTFHFASVSASPNSQTWMDMLLEQRELEEMEMQLRISMWTKSWFKLNWVRLICVHLEKLCKNKTTHFAIQPLIYLPQLDSIPRKHWLGEAKIVHWGNQ